MRTSTTRRLAELTAPIGATAWLLVRRPPREPPPSTSNQTNAIETLIQRLAAQDWLVLVYLAVLLYTVAGAGARRGIATACVLGDLALFGAVLWFARGATAGTSRALVYRLGILGAILGSFFELQWILPAASGPPVDAALHAFDLAVFGIEPATAWDRFVSPATTEWFSFFYYAYFLLVAAHVLPLLFLGRDARTLVPFAFGFLWLYCVGHVVYTVVPAYGPYASLSFAHPLEGRLWWPLVRSTVASVDGSARTDVFPSLHTAGPTFLATFSFLHRRRGAFRYTWAPLALATTQIVCATMFLRWHYLVDIIAGLALAASGIAVGRAALCWDEARVAAGGPESFPPLPAWVPTLRRGVALGSTVGR